MHGLIVFETVRGPLFRTVVEIQPHSSVVKCTMKTICVTHVRQYTGGCVQVGYAQHKRKLRTPRSKRVHIRIRNILREDLCKLLKNKEKHDKDYDTLHSRCLLLCRQLLRSSFLWFKVAMCGLQIRKYFSVRQRLHLLLDVEYGLLWARIFHLMEYWTLISINDQINWLRAVAFLCCSFLKVLVCPLYLVLKLFSVRPT